MPNAHEILSDLDSRFSPRLTSDNYFDIWCRTKDYVRFIEDTGFSESEKQFAWDTAIAVAKEFKEQATDLERVITLLSRSYVDEQGVEHEISSNLHYLIARCSNELEDVRFAEDGNGERVLNQIADLMKANQGSLFKPDDLISFCEKKMIELDGPVECRLGTKPV